MALVDARRWAQLSERLDELLDLDASARDARIAELRAADPELADELAKLLAQQPLIEQEQFLDGQVLDLPGVGAERALAGRTFGAWTLERQLGVGGMGSVWLARRSDGRFEGRAAVKLLNLALAGRGGAQRFSREGSALARLSHPHIARLLDAGVDDGGQPYLVLEHVEGEPIDRWCDAQRLDTAARIRLVLDVMEAVAHAHGKLVLHRDLKPGNILVTRGGEVKLLDFGIAKLLADGESEGVETELTQVAGRAFTLEYAAPEQVQDGEATTATDVYALGVLLYGLLGGGHPTTRPTDTRVQRLRAVVEQEPRKLSDAAANGATPRQVQALKGDLDNIVAKALKKPPAERYATVAAFADDLRRHLAKLPVTARPDTWAYRSSRFVRRHRLSVGAAAITLLALVGGVVGTAWQAVEARRERDEAVFQAQRAAARGGMFALLLAGLTEANRPLTQREILDRAVQLVEARFAGHPRVAIDLLLPIAGQYYTLGDSQRDHATMQRASEMAARVGDPLLIADVACNTVNTEVALGRIEAARGRLETAQRAAQALRPAPFGLRVGCLRATADVARAEGRTDEALAAVSEAIELTEREGDTRAEGYPTLLSFKAALLEERGDYRESQAWLERDRQVLAAMGRAGATDLAAIERREASLLMAWGQYADARAIVERIRSRWSDGANASGSAAAAGAADGRGAPAWLELPTGELLMRLGRHEEAETLLRQAAERSRERGNVQLAVPLEFAQARALVHLRRLDEAERVLQRVESAQPVPSGRYRALTPGTLRARMDALRGDAERAARRLQGEVAHLRMLVAGDSLAQANALRALAELRLQHGDLAAARADARAALAMFERIAREPGRSADVGEAALLLANIERAAGDAQAMRPMAQQAASALLAGLGPEAESTRAAQAMLEG